MRGFVYLSLGKSSSCTPKSPNHKPTSSKTTFRNKPTTRCGKDHAKKDLVIYPDWSDSPFSWSNRFNCTAVALATLIAWCSPGSQISLSSLAASIKRNNAAKLSTVPDLVPSFKGFTFKICTPIDFYYTVYLYSKIMHTKPHRHQLYNVFCR